MNLPATDQDIKLPNGGPLRIVMADSDATKIAEVAAYVGGKIPSTIRVCSRYPELLPLLKEELPDLLFLGFFDALNFFSICRMCRKNHEDLPIILLSRQAVIDDEMRRAALTQGANDIVSTDLGELARILQPFMVSTAISWVGTGQTILTAMNEINGVGSNFFGPLAQGNYWRKSHTQLLDEYPTLQKWSADHFGVMSCDKAVLQSQLTGQDLRGLRKWVHLYICECQRVIIDFGDILQNSDLSPAAIQLLPETFFLG
jgi:CheY-like chemotaxis protein